ncbi:hypothetical protein GCM10010315_41250 [Streptomyces luteosporeus]|uniref:Uncharacterized protein n=1 Tax=Streptomyces luteosporeus TaxID=173856 RepID=A0ABN3TWX5_9ACTN
MGNTKTWSEYTQGECNDVYEARGDVYGGDPDHTHRWSWTGDDGNGHMGWVCACSAYRP